MLRRSLVPLFFAVACAPAAAPQGARPAEGLPGSGLSPADAPPGAAGPAPGSSAAASPGYDKPPSPLLEALRAPPPPAPILSPTEHAMLLATSPSFAPMAQVAEPYLKLAGTRIEPRTRRKHDTPGGYGIASCLSELRLVSLPDGAEKPIALPPGCTDGVSWSPDGQRILVRVAGESALELWVADAASPTLRRIPGVRLNGMFGRTSVWLSGSQHLVAKLVPEGQGAAPPPPRVPPGPNVQESDKGGESSTYETRDTLKNAHDEALFDYYGTSQLAVVDLATSKVTPIGKPGLYTEVDPAPDGQHLKVHSLARPYSYVTTYERFPQVVEVWNRAGALVRRVASLPLADRVPVRGVPVGPREFEWRSTEPATLVWAEALDGGDLRKTVPARDKVMMHKAPFDGAPREVLRTEFRYEGLTWGEKPGVALLREEDQNRQRARTYVLDVDAAAPKPKLLWDLSTRERYTDPGRPMLRLMPNGHAVMREVSGAIFLRGGGASPEGDRPFLDRFELATGRAERLFRSDKDALESVLGFAKGDPKSVLTWRQSKTDPPNVALRTLGAAKSAPAGEATTASTFRAVTHMPDPTPAVRAIEKRIVRYERADGTKLSLTLYTPPGYKAGTRLPTILYAYPLDYLDPAVAGQVTGSEKTFVRLRGHQLLLLAGYAVVEAAFPILGDPRKAYDTYLEQLVANAKAAIDKGVELGVVDRDRVGVTGHSHGALMTANLLAHSDFFKAGVASSGAYNKALTPFGFQNERRSLWEARDVYIKASPFFFADKLKTPILLVHGEDDANPGTTPLQGVKFYEALRGNGATTRLVMLPHEPHWYTALESNEHFVAEMLRWFDRYVKGAPPPR